MENNNHWDSFVYEDNVINLWQTIFGVKVKLVEFTTTEKALYNFLIPIIEIFFAGLIL